MKVLIVCSGNAENFSFQLSKPFVYDQVEAVRKRYPKTEFGYFFVKGKGWGGYLSNLKGLKEKIKKGNYDLIHAHGGDCVLLATLQRKIPVIGTYHGSDLNNKKNRVLSNIASLLSKKSIVVSKKLYEKLWRVKNTDIIPCGVDLDIFYCENKLDSRKKLKLPNEKLLILFSSTFTRKVKNYPLAKKAISLLNNHDIVLIEFKGYKRHQIKDIMSAVDLALMTSFTEGSPQFIKEAMACNLPIVSTDVGDVKDVVGNTEGCFVTSYDSHNVAKSIGAAIDFGRRTNGRKNINHFDNNIIADKVMKSYKDIKESIDNSSGNRKKI